YRVGKVVRQTLIEDAVRAIGKVRPVLFEDSPGHDEHRPGAVQLPCLSAGEIGEMKNLGGGRDAPEGEHYGERFFHQHLDQMISKGGKLTVRPSRTWRRR